MTTVPALTDEAALNQYVATGGQTDFTFSFMIFATADIKVYVNGVLKTEVTDYTVKKSGGGSISASDLPLDGGKVVFVSGLTLNDEVTLTRNIAIARSTGYSVAGAFRADVVNAEFTKALAIMQQLRRDIERSISLAPSDSEGGSLTLPIGRANKLLGFDADGNIDCPLEWANIQEDLSTLVAIGDDITTVAGISSAITTVSGISAAVSTVSSIHANVTTVAGISSNVTTVAGISSNVTTVAGIASAVSSCAANMASIQNAASFGFPTLGGSDDGKFLKVNAGSNGYILADSLALILIEALTPTTNTIPYFDSASTAGLLTLGTSINNIPQVGTASATEGLAGLAELATQGETDTGVDDARIVTPLKLKASAYTNKTLIATASASSSATIDFTGLSNAYTRYILEITDLKSSNDGVSVYLRMSGDAGVSYDAGASDYRWLFFNPNNYNEAIAAQIQMVDTVTSSRALGNASGEFFNATIEIFNPSNSSHYCTVRFHTTHQSQDNIVAFNIGAGQRSTNKAIDAIRILLSSGTITSGTFKLYGVK